MVEPKEVIKEIEENFPRDFFTNLLKSFNPGAYRELSLHTLKSALSYLFSLAILGFILMLVIGIPLIANLQDSIAKNLANFDRIELNATVTMKQPLYIRQLGLAVDTRNDRNLTNEKILITKNTILLRKPLCYLEPACILTIDRSKSIEFASLSNPLQNKESFANLLYGLIIFLLPSIVVTLLVFIIVKYLCLTIIFTVIGMLFVKITNRRLKIGKIWKICVFSLTALILLDSINIPLGLEMSYLPFLLSLFYLFTGILVAGERGYKQ